MRNCVYHPRINHIVRVGEGNASLILGVNIRRLVPGSLGRLGSIPDSPLRKDPGSLTFSCGRRSKTRSEAPRLAIPWLTRAQKRLLSPIRWPLLKAN